MEKTATNLKKQHGFHVLIPAAGSGTRLAGDIPKQYQKIAGKPVLRHTIEAFLACPGLRGLYVIIDPAHEILYQEAVKGLDLHTPIHGSNSRNKSILNGLKELSNKLDKEKILIHDAARPLVRRDDITALVAALEDYDAATLAVPVADTLRHGEHNHDKDVARNVIDRTGLWAIQTPQGFRFDVLYNAHQNADPAKDYTDDTALVSDFGVDVAIVKGHRQNFKITTPDDMEMAQILMQNQTQNKQAETRTATGFDVHAFTEGNSVRLCGVDIPHDKALSGHSDADVALHALTDALLGCISAGDIGQHFPPSDPQWKGAESHIFLKKAVALVTEKSGTITHLDLTLICEAPKVGPHRAAMQKRVAEICGITTDRVSIKATTTEGLGFTGRKEGIAAQATASVRILNKTF